jgi:hypothetical protein
MTEVAKKPHEGGPDDVQTAWRILAGGAPTAAAALVDIADHGKSELARVQASQAILDRVGLATPKERPMVSFTVIPKEFNEAPLMEQLSPAEVVRQRLKELAGPTAALVQGSEEAVAKAMGLGDYAGDPDAEIVDAELMPLDGAQGDGDDWGNPWS